MLPPAMADWANHVRGIGNDTHTDDAPEPLPTKQQAEEALLFANMLSQYLYVLPARIPKPAKAATANDTREKPTTTEPEPTPSS